MNKTILRVSIITCLLISFSGEIVQCGAHSTMVRSTSVRPGETGPTSGPEKKVDAAHSEGKNLQGDHGLPKPPTGEIAARAAEHAKESTTAPTNSHETAKNNTKNNFHEDIDIDLSEPTLNTTTSNKNTTTEQHLDGSKIETTVNPNGVKNIVTFSPDGKITQAVSIKPDGTKSTSTYHKDGTTTILEEHLDGSKIETNQNTNGTTNIVNFTADGKITQATSIKADGTKSTTTYNSDGTSKITNYDAQGKEISNNTQTSSLENNAPKKAQAPIKPPKPRKPTLLSEHTAKKENQTQENKGKENTESTTQAETKQSTSTPDRNNTQASTNNPQATIKTPLEIVQENPNATPLEILGLPEDATLAEINSAYRKLSLKYHPDKSTNSQKLEIMKTINKAKEDLAVENTSTRNNADGTTTTTTKYANGKTIEIVESPKGFSDITIRNTDGTKTVINKFADGTKIIKKYNTQRIPTETKIMMTDNTTTIIKYNSKGKVVSKVNYDAQGKEIVQPKKTTLSSKLSDGFKTLLAQGKTSAESISSFVVDQAAKINVKISKKEADDIGKEGEKTAPKADAPKDIQQSWAQKMSQKINFRFNALKKTTTNSKTTNSNPTNNAQPQSNQKK